MSGVRPPKAKRRVRQNMSGCATVRYGSTSVLCSLTHRHKHRLLARLFANLGAVGGRVLFLPSAGIEEKTPKGHSETVAVLTFALSKSRLAEFTEEHMRIHSVSSAVTKT